MVIGRLKLFYHNMNQETCADCGYMRSTLSPCKCGKYASILPASESEAPAAIMLHHGVRLLVLGVTERHGQAWDLVCNADGIGTIIVDPFVSCAWPIGTDSDRRAMVGKEYVMADFQVADDGCYLPEKFNEPNMGPSRER